MDHANVLVFKLTNGEEIIGEVRYTDSDLTVIKHPLGLAINPEEGRLVFVPYMPYTAAPEEITVYNQNLVIAPVKPIDSIVNDYESTINQIFGPGIIMPPAPERALIRPVK